MDPEAKADRAHAEERAEERAEEHAEERIGKHAEKRAGKPARKRAEERGEEHDEEHAEKRDDGEGTPAWHAWLRGWPLVVGIALAVRLLYLLTADGPAFEYPILDADYYDFLGDRLARGEGFPPEPFWQPPLYPLLLGGLYRLFGHTLWAPRLLQAAMGAAAAGLCFEIARRVTGKVWAGRAAGLFIALHGPLVFYDGELLSTSLGVFLVALILWIAICVTPSWKSALGLGALVGAGALAVAPLFLLVFPAAWAVAARGSLRPLVCAAAAVAVITPVTLINRAQSGEWILISANSGVNLWIGNNPDVDGAMAIRPGAAWERLVSEPERAGVVGAGAQSDYFVKKAARFCASAPVACLKNLAFKVRLLFVSRDLPRNEDLYVVREQSPVLSLLTVRRGSTALPYALLWPLAAAGAALSLMRRDRARVIVVAAAVVLAAPCVLFFVTGRYRAPLAPALCVLAGVCIAEIVEQRARQWVPAAAGIFAMALAVWPVRLRLDRVSYRAELHYAIGGRLARLGDDEGSARALERALAIRSDYPEAAFNLALTLERLERPRDAVRAYERALARHPEMLEARLRRANALLDAGEIGLAEEAFLSLSREMPGSPEVAKGLARVAAARGAP